MQKKFDIFFISFLWSSYGAGTGTGTVTFQKWEPEPEPYLFKSWNRNHNFSKVETGSGTLKNSYGSTTLV